MLLGFIVILLIGLYSHFNISIYIIKSQPDYQKISYMLAAYTYARGKLPAPIIYNDKSYLPYKALGLNIADVSNEEGIIGYYATLFTENEHNNSSISLATTIHQVRAYHSTFCLYQHEKENENLYILNYLPISPPKCMMGYPHHPSRDFFFDTKNLDLAKTLNCPIHNLFQDLLVYFQDKFYETEEIIPKYLWDQCHLIIRVVSQTLPYMSSVKSYIQEFAHFTNSFLPHTFYCFRKYHIGPEGIHYGYNTGGHTIFYTPTNIPKDNKSLIKITNFSETLDYMDKNFTIAIIGAHPTKIEEKCDQNTQYQNFIYSNLNKEYFLISKNQLLLYMPLNIYEETKLPDYEGLMGGGSVYYYEGEMLYFAYYPHDNRICMPKHKWGIKINDFQFTDNEKLDIPFLKRLCYIVEEI